MFAGFEVDTILKGLKLTKAKNDELTMLLGGMKDPEVEEINALISSIKEKFAAGKKDFESFSQEELAEMKTGVMGLLANDIHDGEAGVVLGRLNEILD